MRIGIAWREFHELSGLPKYCTELARRLARADEVYLFARRVVAQVPAKGVVTFPFFFTSKRIEYGPNTLLNSLIVVRGKRRLGLDIVNTQDATLIGQDVITVHGTWWSHYRAHAMSNRRIARELRRSVIPIIEKFNFRGRHYRRLIASSLLVSSELRKGYGVPEDDISIVYDGVDSDRFRPDLELRSRWRRANGFKDEVVLLHVSTDFLRKGLITIVKALAVLPSSYHVVVVGRDDPSPYLTVARELGVDRRIHIVPSANQLEEYYNGCDLYVFPTYYESFGLTLLEAMACGKPVVCTRETGASELMHDGRDAVLLDRWDDPRELASKVTEVVGSGAMSTLGREARQTASVYTWERTAVATRKVYEEALRQ